MSDYRFRILFVDDEEAILNSLRRLMRRHDYDCWFASSGREGLAILEQTPIDLVVSDMRMPEMDGAQFLTEVRNRWPFTVRFLMTGYADMSATIDALNLGGINRYVSKPWDNEALIEAIEEGLRIRKLERQKKKILDQSREQNQKLQKLNEELEQRVNERTRALESRTADLQKAFRQLENSYDAFVRVFSSVIASRPHLVKGRSREVADLARRLAQRMELETGQIRYIYYAALLHEVGKLSLNDDVLGRSETQLTFRDLSEYRQYPTLGEMALMPIKALRPCAELIRSHMENLDGSGFPDGLAGDAVPLGARIIRASRDFVGQQTPLLREVPASPPEAYSNMKEHSGRYYDPAVLAALEPLVNQFTLEPQDDTTGMMLPISDLRPGMELTRDIVSTNGILLMVKGTVLNESAIKHLQRMSREDRRQLKVSVTVPAGGVHANEE
ncbi:HD domain-containing phosphohydrolase [Halomonadaceae bacterium KBTZ08]